MPHDMREPPEAVIERLQARILELEDFQQRVESDAAETIAMAEELAIARDEAHEALKRAEEYQETIRKLALVDPLTGISNRNQFNMRFDDTLAVSRRNGTKVALMLFDLDRFKSINDTYGHPVGDELLKYVANQLIAATREVDTAARLGGDEFALILAGLDQDTRATKVARRIIDTLGEPITLSGCLLKTGTSIGISLYPRDGNDAEDLLRTADRALYVAKGEGRGAYRYFDPAMDQAAKAAHVLESDMRLGVVRGEFTLHYQPQMTADGSRVSGVEALVRWRHPTRGLLMPGEFIDAAEANGLITAIGRNLLTAACKQCRAWETDGLGALCMAVNISAIQFKDPDFVQFVENAFTSMDLPPERLELEVTESLMMDDMEAVIAKLQQLRDLGVRISVDDFGTGYSSLAYLKKLPIEKVKIDRAFVRNLPHDGEDTAIVDAVVRIGRGLGLDVIAEGVETAEQAAALSERGCGFLQGYLFAKPMPADGFADWMRGRGHGGGTA